MAHQPEWSWVDLSTARKPEYMVIRKRVGGDGWAKVCLCSSEYYAKSIVNAINSRTDWTIQTEEATRG